MIQAALRLSIDLGSRSLCIDRATLPPFLDSLRLLKLDVPFGTIDLLFERQPVDVGVSVLKQDGDFQVRVVK